MNGKIPYAGKEIAEPVKAHSLSSAATNEGDIPSPADGLPDDGSIPAALDRTVGLTKEQIDAKREEAIKKAGKPKKAKAIDGNSKKPKTDNLTEADKKAIKELKKAGANKVSTIKKHGASLKSEKKAKAPKASKAPKSAKKDGEPRPGSKTALIAGLLTRPNGCTTKDVLDKCDWPTVSMPAQAKAAGLKLRKEKKPGELTRYYGS